MSRPFFFRQLLALRQVRWSSVDGLFALNLQEYLSTSTTHNALTKL